MRAREFTLAPVRFTERLPALLALAVLTSEVLFIATLLALLFGTSSDAWSFPERVRWIWGAVGGSVAAGIAAAVVAELLLRRSKKVRAIRLGTEGVVLPRVRGVPFDVEVPYRHIRSVVEIHGRVRGPHLVVGVEGRVPFRIRGAELEDPDALERLGADLRRRVGELPDGSERLRLVGRRGTVWRAMQSARAPVTWIVLAALAAVLLLEWWEGALVEPLRPFSADAFALLRLGANAPWRLGEGEWFRLVTSLFLHAGPLHFGANAFVIIVAGRLIERLLGSARLATILFASGVAGALARAAWGGDMLVAVGASPACFGLLGSWLFLNLRRRSDLLFTRSWRLWLVAATAVTAEALLFPAIDSVAHAGGFAAGIATTASLVPRDGLVGLRGRRSWGLRASAAFVSAVTLAALVQGFWAYRQSDESWLLRAMEPVLRDPQRSPAILNEVAWRYGVADVASRDQLEAARAAMLRTTRERPDVPAYRDTLATLQFRLGEFGAAAAIEGELLRESPGQLHASQLARFERHLHAAHHGSAERGSVVLRTEPDSPENGRGRALWLGDREPSGAVEVRAIAVGAGDTLRGYAWARFACDRTGTDPCVIDDVELPPQMGPLRFEVTAVRTATGETGAPRWRYWPMDPRVAVLPGPLESSDGASVAAGSLGETSSSRHSGVVGAKR